MNREKFVALFPVCTTPVGECLEWRGYRTQDGYAKVYYEGKQITAHRASYMAFVGPIPADRQIDHLCRNRACANPKHLELVTQRENIFRGICSAANNKRKTHCIYGHKLPEDRICKTCQKRRGAAQYARRLAAPKPTHCRNGHSYEGNRYKGGRCIICTKERGERKRAASLLSGAFPRLT